MKQAGELPDVQAEALLDPTTSTVSAVRCFGWAAQALGMGAPALIANPEVNRGGGNDPHRAADLQPREAGALGAQLERARVLGR